MKALVQRCSHAEVRVQGNIVGCIDHGLCLLVGFTDGDDEKKLLKMVEKVLKLRIFPDENGVMNKSVLDVQGSILSISQFTLYADTSKGNRPSYMHALRGEEAIKLYERFNEELQKSIPVETGIFGSHMEVSLTNMGPTTILLEM